LRLQFKRGATTLTGSCALDFSPAFFPVIPTEAARLFPAHGFCAPGRVVEGPWQPCSATPVTRTKPINEDLPPFFSSPIHKFAQAFPPISIDAPNRFHYLPHQIEPGSLELYGSV
jgi:hypothetical protein